MITNQEFIVAWTMSDGASTYLSLDSYEEAESFLEGLNSPEHFAYLSIVIKRV